MENQSQPLQTMYLSTIPNMKRSFNNNRAPLDVSDIAGARSRYIQHPKPMRDSSTNFYNIDKSHPKQLIPTTVNKPSFLLQVDDIPGTRTKINKFTTTRFTNPLQPKYQSPKVEYLPHEQPKFIRDGMTIDDIQGVRSRQTFAIKLERAGKSINTKDELLITIKPTPKGFTRNNPDQCFSLNVEDINKGETPYPDLEKRITNPLQPVYNIDGNKSYGFIQGSKIKEYQGSPLRQNNSLKNDDIEGSKPKYNNFICGKKDEIVGAKPQTLKRGISTNRKTDPLQPRYNYLGTSQIAESQHFTRPKTAAQKFDQFIK